MEVDLRDPEITHTSTRCCGASVGTPHWAGCVERLDVNDPASYRGRPDEDIEPEELVCDNCSRTVKEGEFRDVDLANDAGGMRICDDCWERVP